MNEKEPKISVIIPAFDSEKSIKKTIYSVLNQTFRDFELIIVNDGSNDSTLEIINQLKDKRIQILDCKHSGAAVSRNRGLKKARGEYIAFLDADDLWTPEKLSDQIGLLHCHSEYGVVYSWTDLIDESDQFLHSGLHATDTGCVLPKLLLINILESGSNPLIRRRILQEIGGIDESLLAFQDADLYIRLAEKTQFTVVPKVQIYYRRSKKSVSSNVVSLEEGGVQSLQDAFDRAPENIKHMKKYSLSNHYKIVLFKAIHGIPDKLALRSLFRIIMKVFILDYHMLFRRVSLKIIFKVILITVLPERSYRFYLTKWPWLQEFYSLLGYMKTNPF